MGSAHRQPDRDTAPLGTGIIITAILLIVGYVIISRIIGLAFRLVVPLVLIVILAGAGIFSGLMPDHAPDHYTADQDRPDGPDRRFPDDGRHLGDMRLRDIGDTVTHAVRSALRGTLAFLDGLAGREPMEHHPRSSEPRRWSRDRFDEVPPGPDEEPSWDHSSRPGRAY
jgi:hypothetical protein